MPRKGENIYKRRDGRWEGRYKVGFNESGKVKYRSVYGHSYAEVKDKLLPLKAGPYLKTAACNLTVKELFDEWLSGIKIRVKASTYANYHMKVEKHIIPVFGDLRYDMLTVQMIHAFIDEKLISGLSPKYVSDVIIVFKAMGKYTSKVYGTKNILADVVNPKYVKEEKPLLTQTQQRKLCNYLLSNLNATSMCVLLSYYTGLRVGEVCGLMWDDIDFDKSILAVRRTVQRIRANNGGTQLIVSSPKSRTSQRMIPIPNFVMKMLRELRSGNNYYILSESTRVIEPRTLQNRFKSILKKVDLPSICYHSLRHMFATNCLQAGFDVKTLSEILGHASVETTLNRYVHSSLERKAYCMSLLSPAA